ncbi:iron ABC transporter permease [Bacillus canaveralius]|uniref:Iron ABC transporter permease n=1 Tax=Bacillus canaveralius TaxID=1403243 RepID=A0A2N5GKJ6_9BACI|nr:iron ABC transporter permease [Bacillus canaveralius]PLR82031.1 iron ABC transporter permease [Bacillus canaveralius]PLR99417.1 iron ABC transporter permease [Bacillus canaveralius]RSK48657.1 iron ABC transporter permease [Bacillus canaveralius]
MSKYFSVRDRSGRFSFHIEKKMVVIFSLLLCLSLLLFIVGLSVGSTMINPLIVLLHLLGLESTEYQFTIDTLRLPRMILSLLVGMALGVSGLILQGIVRNPLASPDIIGITGGASAAAVLFITYFSGTISIKFIPFAAILGAGIVSLVIYILAWKKGVTPIRLVLIGIGVAAAMGALTTMMIVLNRTYTTGQAYIWLTGSVYGANWENVYSMLPWVLIFVPLALLFSREVNVQELGDQVALGLGSRVQYHRFALLIVSVALAGSAVAYAGGIGFVGLIAPHIARKLVGRSFGGLVPVAALIGGLIVILADVVARTAFLPLDLPAGVFVSGIGAPFFIYLLYRNRNM